MLYHTHLALQPQKTSDRLHIRIDIIRVDQSDKEGILQELISGIDPVRRISYL